MSTTILWADDEIDLLKPHILFLERKGYEVIPTVSGNEAIEILKTKPLTSFSWMKTCLVSVALKH